MKRVRTPTLIGCIWLLAEVGTAQPLRPMWEVPSLNSPPDEPAYFTSLAADTTNNCYVVGFEGLDRSYRFVTRKFLPDGTRSWTRRYFGQVRPEAKGSAIALDDSGNVYVTGYAIGDTIGWVDFVTIKYSPGGEELWVATYTTPRSGADVPHDIAVDDSGNVYVAGETFDGYSLDFLTVKYGPTGRLAWAARYAGPGHGDDVAYRVGFDSAGSVYVLGPSVGIGKGADYTLFKYDRSGNRIWEMRYDSPDHFDDFPNGFALARDGSGYVTGTTSSMTWPYSSCTTVRFTASGAVEWDLRKTIATYSNSGIDVAMDPSGAAFVIGYGYAAYSDHEAVLCIGPDGGILWQASQSGAPVRILSAPWGGAYYATAPASVGAVTTAGARGLGNPASGTPVSLALGGRGNVFLLTSTSLARFIDTLYYVKPDTVLPTEFALSQNFPNPFNSGTVIRYQLPLVSTVKLAVYDLLGREVAVLVDGREVGGIHDVTFDARGLASGCYFYKLTSDRFTQTRKSLLVR